MKKEIAKQPNKDWGLYQEVAETLDDILKAVEEKKDLASVKVSNNTIKIKNKAIEAKEKQNEKVKKAKEDMELKWKLHNKQVKKQLDKLKIDKEKSPLLNEKTKEISKSAMQSGMKKFIVEKRNEFQEFKKQNDETKKKKDEEEKLFKIQEAQKKKDSWEKFLEGQKEKLVYINSYYK